MIEAVGEFRAEMRRAGLDYVGPIIADGKLHRFKVEGDRDRNSWLVLFAGPPVAGKFGCWKRGINAPWCHRNGEHYSHAQWTAAREHWRQAEEQRAKVEADDHATARKRAASILSQTEPAKDHPYLEKKGVKAYGDGKCYRGSLVLPLRDIEGVIHSLQFISADSSKKFLTSGRVQGCFFSIPGDSALPLIICEGYATGASIHEATGCVVICAMHCGNAGPVAEALRAKYPEREMIVAADNDAWTDGNPGIRVGTEVANLIGSKLVVPQFKNTAIKPTDFNDLHLLEGLDVVREQIAAATIMKETDSDVFTRLAALLPSDYDRRRAAEAKKLGIRIATLDQEVEARRPKSTTAEASEALRPWPDSVNGAVLLDQVRAEYQRFVILPEHGSNLLALWTLHTYCWQHGEYSPILAITSPTRACGKSRVLDVLAKLTSAPFRTGNLTEAVLFRIIEAQRPTALIDEFDSIKDEARAAITNILKNGFNESGCVQRVEGDKERRVANYSCYCPKAIACIKLATLDPATASRAINLRMQKKRREQKTERLRKYNGLEWRQKCARWVADHAGEIKSASAAMPEELDDREQDIWEPLFILANLCGGPWPDHVREAALVLCRRTGDETEDSALVLLEWIRRYFTDTSHDRVASKDLCVWLNEQPDAGFKDWRAGKGIEQRGLARTLAGFDVAPGTIRLATGDTAKGYHLAQFSEAFTCYLTAPTTSERHTVTMPVNIAENDDFTNVTEPACDGYENSEKLTPTLACDGVSDKKPELASVSPELEL